MRRHTTAAVAAVALMAGPALAQVETIPVRNAGFEAERLSETGGLGQSYKFEIRDWIGDRHGIFNVEAPVYPSGEAPEGRNVAFLSNPNSWMSQTLSGVSLEPNRRYIVRVKVGMRSESGFGPGRYGVELYAGDQLLVEETAPTPPNGSFREELLTYVTSSQVAAGGDLRITFRNLDTRQINFDDVRVTISPFVAAQPPEETLPIDPDCIDEPEVIGGPVDKPTLAGSYWFARIVPISDAIPVDPDLRDLFDRGVYLHLQPNGAFEFNWSTPGSYAPAPGHGWTETPDSLSLRFPDISYTFDVSERTGRYVTYSNEGGAFEMTLERKAPGER